MIIYNDRRIKVPTYKDKTFCVSETCYHRFECMDHEKKIPIADRNRPDISKSDLTEYCNVPGKG